MNISVSPGAVSNPNGPTGILNLGGHSKMASPMIMANPSTFTVST